jgi:hypothetical protein
VQDITTLACPGHNELAPRAGAPVWCGPCTHHLRGEVDAFPYLASSLQREAKNATSNGFEHVSGSKERPIHPSEKYTFFIETIDDVLAEWAGIVVEDRHLSAVFPTRQGPRISATTALLLIHFDWLIAEHPNPDASEAFGLEIRRTYRKARKLTRSDEVRPEPCDGVTCPKCDLMMLERELDWQGRATGYIACANCGDLMTAAEYERWVKMLAAPLRRRAA